MVGVGEYWSIWLVYWFAIMGIKGLWGVLTPYSEKKSLHEIRGEIIAVDLSGWVCDSQNVTDYHIKPKLYLRNLFFRTIYLLLADIKPIFVLEGDAPELKRDVMAARNAIQFRGAALRSEPATTKRPDVGRKRFRAVQRECEALLECMGVSCVKGRGEAEATCAQLNAQGLVDAVVSQDSDCFAYGATRVYRNFSVCNAAGGGALQGSVDCYDARKMAEQNGFGRNKMVALALLCGCDYGLGACGSSITTVVAFLHTVPDKDIIPRLVEWVSDPQRYSERSRWAAAPGRCDRCGHCGRRHAKSGCPVCNTHSGCNDTGHKTKLAEVKRELALRTRALNCGAPFPEPKVMKEFLQTPPEAVSLDHLKTSPPSLVRFMKMMTGKLGWSERYCVEKFLPLLTKYHLQQRVACRTIRPVKINKKRTPRGVPSYEVVWSDISGQYEGLIPDEQFEVDEDHSLPWTTTERQDLMREFFPELVDAYEGSIKKPVKEKKTTGRKKKEQDVQEIPEKPKRKYNRKTKKVIDAEIANLSNSICKMNIRTKHSEHNSSKANVSVNVNKLKRKLKTSNSQKTIESFLKNKKRKSKKLMESLKYSFGDFKCQNDDVFDVIQQVNDFKENDPPATKKKHSISIFNLSQDDINESDLSDIVDKLVAEAPTCKTATVNDNLVKLVFASKLSSRMSGFRKSILNEIHNNCSTPRQSPVKNNNRLHDADTLNNSIGIRSRPNTSFFFDKLTDDRDAFEMSLELKQCEEMYVSDSERTLEYSLDTSLVSVEL